MFACSNHVRKNADCTFYLDFRADFGYNDARITIFRKQKGINAMSFWICADEYPTETHLYYFTHTFSPALKHASGFVFSTSSLSVLYSGFPATNKQFSWLSPSMEKPISLYFTIFCTIVEVILSPGTIIGIPGG